MKKLPVALCQMKVTADKDLNLQTARNFVEKAVQSHARLVVLPEIFNAPYEARLFEQYAEPVPGPSSIALQSMARDFKVAIVGGSIIEKDETGRLYNTSLVFDHNGRLLARHRKVHLFDVCIPGRIVFQESRVLSSGQNIALFKLNGFTAALLICYDIRFPEIARLAVLHGADLLIVPAAFNLTTGPLHWDLLMRSRAVDNQAYVLACSPARNHQASYQAWGHSAIVDPWGKIIAQAGPGEEIIHGLLDPGVVQEVRTALPVLKQLRTDLYETAAKHAGVITERGVDNEIPH
ncbi:MAG: carbon-nitrogen hydrolase family protein [Syntrophomonadaceae bacterium]